MTRQLVRFDDRVGIRMIRNVQTRARQVAAPYLMRTNSLGFRTREFELEPPVGTRRVLVYGDSFTEGVGVSDGHRFTDLIERSIPDTEVLNFGVRATGTDQQLLFFRERPAGLKYDLVVIGLFVLDVRRNASKYGVLTTADGASFEKPYFELNDDGLTLRNVPVPKAAASYDELESDEKQAYYFRGVRYRLRLAVQDYAPWAKPMLQRLTRYQPARFLNSADNPAWALTRAIVQQWDEEAEAPVLVLAIPPYHYVERTTSSKAYRERFAELAAETGIAVHDPLDDLLAAAKTKGTARLRIRGDAHYAAEGHEVIARSVAPVIERMLAESGRSAETTEVA